MPIKIGCFALVDPFSTLDHQLDRIRDWGFQYADVTDTSDGAVLGNHFGFSAVASLDANPFEMQRLFRSRGLEITSYCAHADLLDASAPWRYGTAEVNPRIRGTLLARPGTPFRTARPWCARRPRGRSRGRRSPGTRPHLLDIQRRTEPWLGRHTG